MQTSKQPLTRRNLFQKAVSAAIPMVVPASALGRIGYVSPGERITVGIIGCGKMAGDFHFPTLLGFKDVQIVAVCDVDANRREHGKKRVETAYSSAASDYKGCAAYNDFRELVARKDIDAVLIATPE